jgi:hypothetical protein
MIIYTCIIILVLAMAMNSINEQTLLNKTTTPKRKRLIQELVLEKKELDIDDFSTFTTDVQKELKLLCRSGMKYTARTRERRIELGKQLYNIPADVEILTFRQLQEHKHASPTNLRIFKANDADRKSLLGEVFVKPPRFESFDHHVNAAKLGVRMRASTRQFLITLLNKEFSKVDAGLESRYNIVAKSGSTSLLLLMEHDEWELLRSRAWKLGREEERSLFDEDEMTESEHSPESRSHFNETIQSEQQQQQRPPPTPSPSPASASSTILNESMGSDIPRTPLPVVNDEVITNHSEHQQLVEASAAADSLIYPDSLPIPFVHRNVNTAPTTTQPLTMIGNFVSRVTDFFNY